uniref:tRNA wybutosine-synthesizing protein 5-like n=1 Tax=Styela clava TaxID=7725 RepID=UPI00193A1AB5|nr:tRNA wybutosine-synthesizing protein 5-like [Styela clava]
MEDSDAITSNSAISVDIIENCSKKRFNDEIQPNRKPCILRDIDIGLCKTKWTVDYLCQNGGDIPVKIHVSKTPQMNFITKNYAYKTLPFKELVRRAAENKHEEYFISDNEYYYLRSLGTDVRKDVADVKKQFPQLADDILIPNFFPEDSFFSSVFRIASEKLQLWTHYDMMDNLLIQVKGRKRVVLFPPTDVENLYLQGDKSEIMDIFTPDLSKYPLFAKVKRYEAFLEPGDLLFIPALWFHNVVALEFGIAVNVFWKNLSPHTLYDKKDPYGNKDLIPAARALDSIKHAIKVIGGLPADYKDFYGRRMAELIRSKTYIQN